MQTESQVFAVDCTGDVRRNGQNPREGIVTSLAPSLLPILARAAFKAKPDAVYEGSSIARLAVEANAGLSRGRLHHISSPARLHTSSPPSRSTTGSRPVRGRLSLLPSPHRLLRSVFSLSRRDSGSQGPLSNITHYTTVKMK